MKENLPDQESACAENVAEKQTLQESAGTDTAAPSREAAQTDAEVPSAGGAGKDAAAPSREDAETDAGIPSVEVFGTDGREIPSEECVPLAWHRFLTRFGLWLEAAIHAFQGVWLLWGGQYYTAEMRSRVRAELPLLWAMDALLALVLLLAAGMCVRAAIVLRRRRSNGARLLRRTYLLLLSGQLIYGAGRWFLIGLTPLSVSVLCPMALYLGLLLVNNSYYRRRRQNATDR